MASIEEVIRQINARLASGISDDANSIDDVIVLPVLSSLGWDVRDPAQVVAQKVGSNVEYLCLLGQGRPRALIQRMAFRHKLEPGAPCLRRHASENGACLAILTNGVAWWFFTPHDGGWPDSPSAVADLTSRNIVASLQHLRRYLSASSVFYLRAPEPLSTTRLQSGSASRPVAKAPTYAVPVAASRPHALPSNLVVETGRRPPRFSTAVAVFLDGEWRNVDHWNELLILTANWLIVKHRQLPYGKLRTPRCSRVLVSWDKQEIAIDGGAQRAIPLDNGAYIGDCQNCGDSAMQAQWLMKYAGFPEDAFNTRYVKSDDRYA